jgi:hypothetical protein
MSCHIPANPDIAGIGVPAATYAPKNNLRHSLLCAFGWQSRTQRAEEGQEAVGDHPHLRGHPVSYVRAQRSAASAPQPELDERHEVFGDREADVLRATLNTLDQYALQ